MLTWVIWKWKRGFFNNIGCAHITTISPRFVAKAFTNKEENETNEFVEGQAWSSSAINLLLDLCKEKYHAIKMGKMKKAYWLTMSNSIWKKNSPKSFYTLEQTKSKWGKIHQQYYHKKGILGIGTQALKWIWYNWMDDMHSCWNYKGLWHTSRNGHGRRYWHPS